MDTHTIDAELTTKDPALALTHRRKLEILFAVLLGLFLGALDQTIVGVALPQIVADLHGSNELYTWVVTIYLLTATITGVFYGKLSDLYGRRPMLLLGIFIFLLGSFLSGLSWSMESLIAFRGLQGVGAGALFPISLAVIGDLFTPAERGKYQGLFGAVFGVSSVIGPLAGGFLTDQIGWHWVFFVNLPIGAVALFIIYRYLPAIKRTGTSRDLDFLGALVFTVAVSLLLIGLTNKQAADWADPSVGGLILVSLLVGAVFILIESRARQPIIPLGLFRDRTYSVSMIAVFLVSFGFFGAIIFLPRWFQFVRGISPTESGLHTLALLVGLIVSSIVAGIIISRTGRYRWLMVGSLAVMSAGLLMMTGLTATTDLPVLWAWMFVTGVGIGPTLAGFTIIVQSAVPFERLGVATSNLTFFRQVGGTVGLALAGTILGQSFSSQLQPELIARGIPADAAARFGSLAGTGGDFTAAGVDLRTLLQQALPPQAQPFIDAIVGALHQAFSLAIGTTMWFGLVATLIAVAVTLALPELPLRGMVRAPGRVQRAGGKPAEVAVTVEG